MPPASSASNDRIGARYGGDGQKKVDEKEEHGPSLDTLLLEQVHHVTGKPRRGSVLSSPSKSVASSSPNRRGTTALEEEEEQAEAEAKDEEVAVATLQTCDEASTQFIESKRKGGEQKTATPPATGSPTVLLEQLRELASLHAAGLLSDDEFAGAKQIVMSSVAAAPGKYTAQFTPAPRPQVQNAALRSVGSVSPDLSPSFSTVEYSASPPPTTLVATMRYPTQQQHQPQQQQRRHQHPSVAAAWQSRSPQSAHQMVPHFQDYPQQQWRQHQHQHYHRPQHSYPVPGYGPPQDILPVSSSTSAHYPDHRDRPARAYDQQQHLPFRQDTSSRAMIRQQQYQKHATPGAPRD